jgi:hypothetical protein
MLIGSHGRNRLPTLLAALTALTPAAPAAAFRAGFTIDPRQSTVELAEGSGIRNGSGPAVAFGFQLGLPGADGRSLPSGLLSDGLLTSLGGDLSLEIDLTGNTLEILAGSRVVPVVSGTWLPGASDPASAQEAQLAVRFEGSGLRGLAAVRDATFAFSTPTPLVLQNDGSSFFDIDGGSSGLWTPSTGALYTEFDAGGDGGTAALPSDPMALSLGGGLLDVMANGELQLTLPVDVTLTLDAEDLSETSPLTASFRLKGEIFAVGQAVPEPGTAALLATGLALLARSARHRSD